MDPFYRRLLNRRRHDRVVPELGARICVVLRWDKGELSGRIHDISLGGLGIAVTARGATLLTQGLRVESKFAVPGTILPLVCKGKIAFIQTLKREALIGLSFDPNGRIAVHALAIQRYVEARQKAIHRWNEVMSHLPSSSN